MRQGSRGPFAVLAAAAGLLSACGSAADPSACGKPYPPLPEGDWSVRYVNPACKDEAPDGTQAHPFVRIMDAVDSAPADPKGVAILAAAGEYPEDVVITATRAWFLAGTPPTDTDPGVVLKPASEEGGIWIRARDGVAPEPVTVKSIRIVEPPSVGIRVTGAKVLVDGVTIERAHSIAVTDAEGALMRVFGFGILATMGADLRVKGSSILDSDSVGILLNGSTGMIGSRDSNDRNVIQGNAFGGIRLEECTADRVALGDGGEPWMPVRAVYILGNGIVGNRQTGVEAFSSRTLLAGNTIGETRPGDSSDIADGVSAGRLMRADGVEPDVSEVDLVDNRIYDNSRVGILFDGGTKGSVTGTDRGQGASTIRGNGRGGIWVQCRAGDPDGRCMAATPTLAGNRILENRFVGIAVTTDAGADVTDDNQIRDTVPYTTFIDGQTFDIAYHVWKFKGARGLVTANRFGTFGASDSPIPATLSQADVLLDDAADAAHLPLQLADNTKEGTNPMTIGIQNMPDVTVEIGEQVKAANGGGSVDLRLNPSSPFLVDDDLKTRLDVSIGAIAPGGGVPP